MLCALWGAPSARPQPLKIRRRRWVPSCLERGRRKESTLRRPGARAHAGRERRLADDDSLYGDGWPAELSGGWLLEGDEWVLRGAYFGEGGQQRVRWKLEEMDRLILEDEEGRQQVWMRA